MLDHKFCLNLCRLWLPVAGGAILAFPSLLRAQDAVLTWHNDAARTGQNLVETVLTPANVNSAEFGKLFTLSVDGKVDAEPLYVPSLAIPSQGTHNVLYVAPSTIASMRSMPIREPNFGRYRCY